MDLGDGGNGGRNINLDRKLLSLLSEFTSNFVATTDGCGNMIDTRPTTVSSLSPMVNSRVSSNIHTRLVQNPCLKFDTMDELFGGARISYIINDIFDASLCTVESFDGFSDEEIRTTICNTNGTRPALFVPEISFDILARRRIATWYTTC